MRCIPSPLARPLFPLTAALAAWLAVAPLARGQDPASTGEDEPDLAALHAFVDWFEDYRKGAIRLVHRLELDRAELDRATRVFDGLAAWNNLTAAQRLFAAAIVDPSPPAAHSSTDHIDFHAELQPWRIRALARERIAAMTDPAVEPWLLAMLQSGNLRASKDHPDRAKAEAAILTLGLRDTIAAKLALMRASKALPAELRLRAVDVLSSVASLELLDHFLDLLRDREPDMRTTALNAIGHALGPLTDETEHDEIPAEVGAARDRAIERMRQILLRDPVWQVRAACAHNLTLLRCRAVIPVLIDGLDAELKRKKDPWAMDMKLHRLLEKMTGLSVPAGSVKPWQQFWQAEGDRFVYVKPSERAARNAASHDNRYAKFFSLELESDALLFIVDFSGSMKETIELKTETTAAKAGEKTTKAALVIDQLKKIVLSLPDGSVFNIIVFSDEVRVWRPNRAGGPALVKLDEQARDELLGSFLERLEPQGPTNLHGALDKALNFAGRGLRDKHYAVDYDTIYVLSDGAPSWGEVTDKGEIRRIVREANRLKRITIHAITFGEQNDVEFLKFLAEENGGRHIHIE